MAEWKAPENIAIAEWFKAHEGRRVCRVCRGTGKIEYSVIDTPPDLDGRLETCHYCGGCGHVKKELDLDELATQTFHDISRIIYEGKGNKPEEVGDRFIACVKTIRRALDEAREER